MKAEYLPIKRGMTEAVTREELEAAEREGREPVANVKQLTWFDTKEGMPCIYGVMDGIVYGWYEAGNYSALWAGENDIFALPRYEWQWLTIDPSGLYCAATMHFQTAEEALAGLPEGWRVERIEGSKRLAEAEGRPCSPERIERLREVANGPEDREQTHAARRVLAKRGIDWRAEQ